MARHVMAFCILLCMLASRVCSKERTGLPEEGRPGGTIQGRVIDEALQTPIEYANIMLRNQADSLLVTGTITDIEGRFHLEDVRPGKYSAVFTFIGYERKQILDIEVGKDTWAFDLGTIRLKQTAIQMDQVNVVAEKPALEYKIDKKIVNVSQQPAAASGTAVDVLENVPSVTVDIEGNVKLRGSSNFTVLVDGRPTIMEPSQTLQQIPSSTIENIEIITNPSAKYDPDGTTGIINVIMKKNQSEGRNGIANLRAGVHDKYGGDALINNRMGIGSLYLGADYNSRRFLGSVRRENRTSFQDTTSYVQSGGDPTRKGSFCGFRGGLDLSLSAADNLNVGARYGQRSMDEDSRLSYDELIEPGVTHNVYTSRDLSEDSGHFYSLNLDYRHMFPGEGHELSGKVNLNKRDGEDQSTNELLDVDHAVADGQKQAEKGPSEELRLQVDYILPLHGNDKIETGFQSRFSDSEESNELSVYSDSLGGYQFQPDFSHTTHYDHEIHSLYAMYSGQWLGLGYQTGLRGEYTYRKIELAGEQERFTIDRWDYFPTGHASYHLPAGQQLMTSYARRIERPRGYYLEPFLTWEDAYNVRRGNPSLKPEYIDSYEMSYQVPLGKSLLSVETYYRVTHNRIERVHSVYAENVTLQSVENVGADYSLGTEFMFNYDVVKWWNVNATGNLYNYQIKGRLEGERFFRDSFNWDVRLNHTVKLGKATRFQINGMYNSPTVSSQGRREGFFVTNLALRQDLLGKILSATLQVNDVFQSGKYEFTSEGKDFYSYTRFTREAPVVMLNMSFNFNDYEPDRERNEGLEEFEGEER